MEPEEFENVPESASNGSNQKPELRGKVANRKECTLLGQPHRNTNQQHCNPQSNDEMHNNLRVREVTKRCRTIVPAAAERGRLGISSRLLRQCSKHTLCKEQRANQCWQRIKQGIEPPIGAGKHEACATALLNDPLAQAVQVLAWRAGLKRPAPQFVQTLCVKNDS